MRLLNVILLLSLFISCSDSKLERFIDLDQLDIVSVSDLFESIDLVPLETNEQCLIADIRKIIFYKDRYYVLDVKQQIVFCFDSQGKFLFKIDNKGQGPEEYLYLDEFNIDNYHDQLLLLEPFGHLLIFDLDGNFVSKTRLPKEIKAYNEVYPFDDKTLIFISLNEYQIVYYSRDNNEIIDKKYKMEEASRSSIFYPSNKMYTYNDSVYFSPPLTNLITNLSKGDDFTWNFGDKNNTSGQIKKLKSMIKSKGSGVVEAQDIIADGVINYYIACNFESSRYKICVIYYGGIIFRHVFFDKILNETMVFDKTIEGIQFFLPSTFKDEYAILYDYANPLITLKSFDESLLSKEQNNLIKSYNFEVDNPILIKYNFKK